MRVVIQRVSEASVEVEGAVVGAIGPGLLVLAAFRSGDSDADLDWMARKIIELRVFEDEAGKMNRAVGEVGGSLLVVSQFTLAADLSRGRRPGFERALPPAEAEPLYEHFASAAAMLGLPVEKGVFGAKMEVSLVNAGPATFWLDLAAAASR